MSYDGQVAVVGIGSVGSMALWRLASRGVDVHGFEQFGIPHDRGAAGGESRMFRSSSLKDPMYVPFSLAALELWRELEAATERSLLTQCGELVIGPPDATAIVTSLRCCDKFDLDHEVLDASDLARRYPQHRIRPHDCGVLDRGGGLLRPELAVLTAARHAAGLGASLHAGTPVREISPEVDGVVVRTDERTWRFEQLVVASGPWIQRLVPQLRGKVQLRRPVQAWFAVDDPHRYTSERFPVFLRSGEDESCYGFPALDGATVKVGLSAKHSKLVDDPNRLDRTVGLDEVARFSQIVGCFLPDMHPDPVRVSAYVEGYTVDNRPIVGRSPDSDRVVLLTGFSGHGFKFAPAFGEIGAQLVVDGDTRQEISPFAPDRDLQDWPQAP